MLLFSARARARAIGGSVALEPPGHLLTHFHTVYMGYPIVFSPLPPLASNSLHPRRTHRHHCHHAGRGLDRGKEARRLSGPSRGVYARLAFSTVNRFWMALLYGRGGRLTALNGRVPARAGSSSLPRTAWARRRPRGSSSKKTQWPLAAPAARAWMVRGRIYGTRVVELSLSEDLSALI